MRDNIQMILIASLAITLFFAMQQNKRLKEELKALQTCYEYGGSIKSSSYDVKSKILRITCEIDL